MTLSGGGARHSLSPARRTGAARSRSTTFLPVLRLHGHARPRTGRRASVSGVTVTGGSTTNVTVNLPVGSVAVTVTWVGAAARELRQLRHAQRRQPHARRSRDPPTRAARSRSRNVPPAPATPSRVTKNGQTGTTSGVSVSSGATTPVTVVMPTGTISVTVTWAGKPTNGASVSVTGGPSGASYTGTTNSSGVANITVPATTAGFPLHGRRDRATTAPDRPVSPRLRRVAPRRRRSPSRRRRRSPSRSSRTAALNSLARTSRSASPVARAVRSARTRLGPRRRTECELAGDDHRSAGHRVVHATPSRRTSPHVRGPRTGAARRPAAVTTRPRRPRP